MVKPPRTRRKKEEKPLRSLWFFPKGKNLTSTMEQVSLIYFWKN